MQASSAKPLKIGSFSGSKRSEESSEQNQLSKPKLSGFNRKLMFKMGKGNKSMQYDSKIKKSLCDSSIF